MDLYVFATPYRVTWDYYFISREHTLEIKEWEERAEYEYVSCHSLLVWLTTSVSLFQSCIFPVCSYMVFTTHVN